ncbi:beta-lactamase-like protein [Dendryphion nanum]|uniref:Beta-lactamase-like protein n=1 Tax=Dendryphion nanum TaxID=256645 RepID=A0A9P9IKK3_9PLEO|nr:beta-lactamase-like protein [Dendryphion nanum]
MKFESGNLAICVTCGTQLDVPLSQAPPNCRMCDDPRQYVPGTGYTWTSLAEAQSSQKNQFTQDTTNPNIWFINTAPKDGSFNPLRPTTSWPNKQLGIGERAILLQTPAGNVLWDLIAFLDEETVEWVKSKGGLKAIVISHPHFYTTHLEWAEVFGCPVYTARADEEWLSRADTKGQRRLIEGTTKIVEGVTAIQVGGHFDGSLILHWDDQLFHADSIMVVPSAFYHKDRPKGTTSYTFMWSYPNMIPLPPQKVLAIWKALKPFNFTATYGGFMGQNNKRPDLKEQLLESMKIFVTIGGHENAAVLQESL